MSDNCVLLDVNLYETKKGKNIWPPIPTLEPDCRPFNSLGAGVVNKRQYYKTGKFPDLPHLLLLPCSNIQAHTFILPNFFL